MFRITPSADEQGENDDFELVDSGLAAPAILDTSDLAESQVVLESQPVTLSDSIQDFEAFVSADLESSTTSDISIISGNESLGNSNSDLEAVSEKVMQINHYIKKIFPTLIENTVSISLASIASKEDIEKFVDQRLLTKFSLENLKNPHSHKLATAAMSKLSPQDYRSTLDKKIKQIQDATGCPDEQLLLLRAPHEAKEELLRHLCLHSWQLYFELSHAKTEIAIGLVGTADEAAPLWMNILLTEKYSELLKKIQRVIFDILEKHQLAISNEDQIIIKKYIQSCLDNWLLKNNPWCVANAPSVYRQSAEGFVRAILSKRNTQLLDKMGERERMSATYCIEDQFDGLTTFRKTPSPAVKPKKTVSFNFSRNQSH